MTFTQAIETVNSRYVPGVVAYYGKQTPDPWELAHSDLEKLASIMDEQTLTPGLERFVERCTALIGRFKSEHGATTSISAADAFAMGDENRVRNHFSRKRKECVKCGGKEALKIVPVPSHATDVMVICGACA